MAAVVPSKSIKVIMVLLILSLPCTPTQAVLSVIKLTIDVLATKRMEISTHMAIGSPTHIVNNGINNVAPPSPNNAEEIPEMVPTAINLMKLGFTC